MSAVVVILSVRSILLYMGACRGRVDGAVSKVAETSKLPRRHAKNYYFDAPA